MADDNGGNGLLIGLGLVGLGLAFEKGATQRTLDQIERVRADAYSITIDTLRDRDAEAKRLAPPPHTFWQKLRAAISKGVAEGNSEANARAFRFYGITVQEMMTFTGLSAAEIDAMSLRAFSKACRGCAQQKRQLEE